MLFAFWEGICSMMSASNVVEVSCLFNALEPVLSSVGGCIACPGACSAVAVRGSRSITGKPMVARNFDYLPFFPKSRRIRVSYSNACQARYQEAEL